MTTIVLDPGHGGNDQGATSGNFLEKEFNLQIALRTRNYLRTNYDVTVLMTREADTTVSLQARTDMSNRANADYFCSIHVNAGGGTGWESYIYNGTVSNATAAAQRTVHNYVIGKLSDYGVRDRGIKRANFHVLRETRMPALLVETLFIDTSADLRLLRNDDFIQTVGDALGEGLARALRLSRNHDADTGLFRVIAGSFRSRTNAEVRRDFLQRRGIEAFIVEQTVNGMQMYRVQTGAFRNGE